MIVNNEPKFLEEIKSYLDKDVFTVLTADNNREALKRIENMNEEIVNLILINTNIPNSNESALFSVKPNSRMRLDSYKNKDFLKKPFTKEQLIDFVNSKI